MSTFNSGLASVTWGVGTYTGFVVQSSTLAIKPGVNYEVFDENGVKRHIRMDDNVTELSLDMITNGGTQPYPGDVINYQATKYLVTSADIKRANKEMQSTAVKGITSTGIALP